MKRLSDTDLSELEKTLAAAGERPFRAKQVFEWTLKKGVFDPAAMTNLSADLRTTLSDLFVTPPLAIDRLSESADGTDKILFKLADGKLVESVLIPTPERTTVCLSSQVGCAVRCRFCASGIDGGKRNLSSGEIVEQFMLTRRHAEAKGRRITNIVMMGMGEPMFNYENVFAALGTINSPAGPNLGARRITVSTVGIRKGVELFTAAKTQYTLAFSLHAPNDEIRRALVPLESAMSVDEIAAWATKYLETTGREVTWEYVMLDGVNAEIAHARELARRFRGIRGTANLIPYNPIPELPYARPSDAKVDAFARELEKLGMKVSVRRRRGADIAAACGQLALKAARDR